MYKIVLTIRNTSFKLGVSINSDDAVKYLENIVKYIITKFKTYQYTYDKKSKKLRKEEGKFFYIYLKHSNEYMFNINALEYVLSNLGIYGLTSKDFIIHKETEYEIGRLNVNLKDTYTPRDYQIKYIEKASNLDSLSFLIDLPTGTGKSLIAVHAMQKINYNVGIIILPSYINKWINDIKKYVDITDDDIYVVQGINSYIRLIESGITYKFVIFATRTMQMIMTEYENGINVDLYRLEKIASILKIGVLFNDETHQEFHTVFKFALYCNVKKIIGSSASLVSNQLEIRNMYNLMFPYKDRLKDEVKFDPHINVVAVSYNISSLKGLRYSGPKGYSHIALEESILKRSILLRDYFDMIDYYLQEGYIRNSKRTENDKVIIFVSRINMAKVMLGYFNKKYGDIFKINTYLEDDPYETIFESNIIISTHMSAGTALDIPGLICILQTVSMASLQANIQNPGRLRNLKNKDVYYYYFYTRSIEAQYRYHLARRDAMSSKTKSFRNEIYRKILLNR